MSGTTGTDSASTPHRPGALVVLLAVAWLLACGGAWWAFGRASFAAGSSGHVAPAWPAGSSLSPARDRPTLTAFVHGRCPCSRASLDELALVLRRSPVPVDARVLVYRPKGAGADWEDELHARAGRLEGVFVRWDDDGREARAFGVATSGHVLLHAPDGTLLFAGGITGSRGHAGPNAGRRALLAALGGPLSERSGSPTPVFGCAILPVTP